MNTQNVKPNFNPMSILKRRRSIHIPHMKPNTIEGLLDALEENGKQLEKAEDKYRKLLLHHNSIEDAIHVLRQQEAGDESFHTTEEFPQDQ